MEQFDVASMGFGSADYIHLFLEAKKLAFEDCRMPENFEPRVEWPRAASSYQQFLSLPSPAVSNRSQTAYSANMAKQSKQFEVGAKGVGCVCLSLQVLCELPKGVVADELTCVCSIQPNLC